MHRSEFLAGLLAAALGVRGIKLSEDSTDVRADITLDDYEYLPGYSGNYVNLPDDTPLDIAGDIDMHVQVKMTRDDTTGERMVYWRHSEGRNLSDEDGWLLADRKEAKDD